MSTQSWFPHVLGPEQFTTSASLCTIWSQAYVTPQCALRSLKGMRQNTILFFCYVVNKNILLQTQQKTSSQLVSYFGGIALKNGGVFFHDATLDGFEGCMPHCIEIWKGIIQIKGQNTIPIFRYVVNKNILFEKQQTASSQPLSYIGNIAPNNGVLFPSLDADFLELFWNYAIGSMSRHLCVKMEHKNQGDWPPS